LKILLLSPPFVPEYMRNARCDFVSLSATQWYPILLGYCGAHLESLGHEVRLIDAPAHGLDHESARAAVRAFRPDLVVLYTGRLSEENDIAFAEPLIDELRCGAVIAGPFASIDPEATLSRCGRIDKLVAGEFEHPVGEIAAGRPPAEILNLVWKDGASVRRNPSRPCLDTAQLDKIPFVSRFLRKQVDVRRYKTPSEFYPFMDILTGRGCEWGRCTYCLWVHTFVKGPVYNQRSIGGVIEEFQSIAREMPEIRSVMIQDDTFTEERARAFSEAKIAAGNRLPWSCYARADMNYEVMALMKRAGCRNLHVGYESADPEVLRRIKKGVSVERAARFTADAKRAGLRIHGDFAVGFPGETPESALETIEWACRLRPHTAQFQLMIPFPGTPFHEEMKKNGWLNAAGEPDMPGFTNEQIRAMAKKAYRRFYLSAWYAGQCLMHPWDRVFSRLKTIARAVPAMFWQRWHVGGEKR
jgi:anaerobic magnesium-protoporphyrin IX monomethyl ester cyclase